MRRQDRDGPLGAAKKTKGAARGAMQTGGASQQGARQFVDRGKAVVAVFFEASPDQACEVARRIAAELADGNGRVAQNRRKGTSQRPTVKRPLPGKHLIQESAKRENIGARIHRFASGLFGRQIADRKSTR